MIHWLWLFPAFAIGFAMCSMMVFARLVMEYDDDAPPEQVHS